MAPIGRTFGGSNASHAGKAIMAASTDVTNGSLYDYTANADDVITKVSFISGQIRRLLTFWKLRPQTFAKLTMFLPLGITMMK